jgi:hypothetical protein
MVQGELLALLAMHLLLTALPGVAAALYLASRGERREPVLLASALAASAGTAMLGFWAYYGSHELGQTWTFLLAFGSILLIGWSLYFGKIDRALLRRLAMPLVLWVLGSAFLVFFGFLHGGTDSALGTAATRFNPQLPSDNDIPLYFAEWFYAHGHHGTPPEFPGEWLASDRPPLQVGYLLAQQPFAWSSHELNYQVFAVGLQQLWIVGLWALLVAAQIGRMTRALVMATVLVSDLAIVHGFFVWPKLLPAALLLAAAALLITPLWGEVRSRLWGGALVAALVGLAMMGHGSSVFGIIPLALIAAYRGLPSWRWLGIAAAVLVVVMAPWSAYQKYGDPPGNRLLKWQIGGVVDVDSRGTLETIEESYEGAGVDGAIHYKAENVVTIAGGGPMAGLIDSGVEALERGETAPALGALRAILYLFLLPSFGLLLLGPLAMLAVARRKRRGDPVDWSFALVCLATVFIGCAAWCLLMFGNEASRTVIHQGSYLLPILGMCAGVAGLRAAFPRAGAWIALVSAVLMLAVYVPAVTPPENSSYSFWSGLIAALCLAGFCFVLLQRERGAEARTVVGEPPAAAIDSPA